MDELLSGLMMTLSWALLRIGLPVGLTLLACWFFRRLDSRWQTEAEEFRQRAGIKSQVPSVRCWLLNDCPAEKREKCPAYQEQGTPCWQHFRAMDGQLKESCIGCDVFRGVPVSAIGD